MDSQGHLVQTNDIDCHVKTYSYSKDGLNLLEKTGDCKNNQIVYHYIPQTNLLSKKFICERNWTKKRTFYFYNEDAVCVKIVEDDGSYEKRKQDLYDCHERHIIELKPKDSLPGIGRAVEIEKKVFDFKQNCEFLEKKQCNSFDAQGNLLQCSVFRSRHNCQYVSTTSRTYNNLGCVTSEIDPVGRTTFYNCNYFLDKIEPFQFRINRKKPIFSMTKGEIVQKLANLHVETSASLSCFV